MRSFYSRSSKRDRTNDKSMIHEDSMQRLPLIDFNMPNEYLTFFMRKLTHDTGHHIYPRWQITKACTAFRPTTIFAFTWKKFFFLQFCHSNVRKLDEELFFMFINISRLHFWLMTKSILFRAKHHFSTLQKEPGLLPYSSNLSFYNVVPIRCLHFLEFALAIVHSYILIRFKKFSELYSISCWVGHLCAEILLFPQKRDPNRFANLSEFYLWMFIAMDKPRSSPWKRFFLMVTISFLLTHWVYISLYLHLCDCVSVCMSQLCIPLYFMVHGTCHDQTIHCKLLRNSWKISNCMP